MYNKLIDYNKKEYEVSESEIEEKLREYKIEEKLSQIDGMEWIPESDCASKIVVGKCFDINNNIVYPFWKSFDSSSKNFHIVPMEIRDEFDYGKVLDAVKDKNTQKRYITAKGRRNSSKMSGSVMNGKKICTEQHKWIEIKDKKMSFLLEFQTLAFDKNAQLNCYLDRIQFYAFPLEVDGPNKYRSNHEFEIMYPTKEEGKLRMSDSRIVYNTKFNMNDKPEDIADAFILFIDEVEKYLCHSIS